MPNQSPYGNLTAILVVVAFLELVIDRLLGRLFLSPGCHTGLGCLLLRSGPFLLHLTGSLTLIVGVWGIAGHLRRGELFPRGMRLTIAVLSLIFMLLLALSLVFGGIPGRYHIHLETSFGFVVALLVLSFVGADVVGVRPRVGVLLFGLPPLLHIAALVAARGGWLTHGPLTPQRLTSIGELVLLVAGLTAPALLIPRGVPRGRIGAAAVLAAGISGFFFVAFLGRTDLVQTLALYSVQLELPRALSPLGVLYVAALFGFVTAAVALLLSPGGERLSGLGICLMGVAGYQTSSPVALGLSLCGMLALATGTVRTSGAATTALRKAPLSPAAWRDLLEGIASALADPAISGVAAVSFDAMTAEPETVPAGLSDVGLVKVQRRGRPVELRLRRWESVVRQLDATVGVPPEAPPDATIEPHETWMARRPEDRLMRARVKTGDSHFDRKLGVHGRAPVAEPDLRRRILRLGDGTITLWAGKAARFVAPGQRDDDVRTLAMPAGPAAVASLVELTDTLLRLVDAASEDTAPPDAAQ